ncbi:hypothetical protein EYF80_031926 [Liparis tanakae]|uniref:Uncharacterized protein n=1 Tax=Liparis tanakae TaxID=230148 RepID=A0A4Z2GZ09_9TELE|nr:hypothetical protein EYF80_031926 [Liparis tanakae]
MIHQADGGREEEWRSLSRAIPHLSHAASGPEVARPWPRRLRGPLSETGEITIRRSLQEFIPPPRLLSVSESSEMCRGRFIRSEMNPHERDNHY